MAVEKLLDHQNIIVYIPQHDVDRTQRLLLRIMAYILGTPFARIHRSRVFHQQTANAGSALAPGRNRIVANTPSNYSSPPTSNLPSASATVVPA